MSNTATPLTAAWPAAVVREMEQPLLDAGVPLMRIASRALADIIANHLGGSVGYLHDASVTLLVGAGGNGGDTLYAGADLARRGVTVAAILTTAGVHAEAVRAAADAGVDLIRVTPPALDAIDDAPQQWIGDAVAQAFAADVIVDGILGIGSRGALSDTPARVVDLLSNLIEHAPKTERPYVVACDIPSGIGVDDGTVSGPVLTADATVTMGVAKPGLILPPAAHHAGDVIVIDLDFTPTQPPAVHRLSPAEAAHRFPFPKATDDKYLRGVVGLAVGSPRYPGAAVLSAGAALVSGVGMVRIASEPTVNAAVIARHPEVVAAPGRVQAWVVGSGTGADDGVTGSSGRNETYANLIDDAILERLPVIVDAGGLDSLPRAVPSHIVLTPHAGELARLINSRTADAEDRITAADVVARPLHYAQRAHALTGATILLKGSTTVIVTPHGVWTHGPATPWLSTAGSGDVLGGILGSLCAALHARGRLSTEDIGPVLALGVWIHDQAARTADGAPVTASQIAEAIPSIVRLLVISMSRGRIDTWT